MTYIDGYAYTYSSAQSTGNNTMVLPYMGLIHVNLLMILIHLCILRTDMHVHMYKIDCLNFHCMLVEYSSVKQHTPCLEHPTFKH